MVSQQNAQTNAADSALAAASCQQENAGEEVCPIKVLVINSGSSSLKYQLVDMATETVITKGICERVGADDSFHKHGIDADERVISVYLPNHYEAVKAVLEVLTDAQIGDIESLEEIAAIGHRVVHGGEYFSASALITDEVLQLIQRCSPLAPLHNPAALAGIRACRELMPDKLQVAAFDTAFHQTMPAKAYMYPLPYELFVRHRIRRYGFHGTSHRYIAERAAALLQKPLIDLKLITCHLGNGCSVAAIDHGFSVDTSMGFTPLEGLMMGTRCGSIDPAIVTYLVEELDMSAQEVSDLMNKQSGLLGISGLSNDLRDIRAATEAGNERAALAYEMYSHSVKKYIGSYVFALGGVDAVVLTAGVGENCDRMRRMIFQGLESLGIFVDQKLNSERGFERVISEERSQVKIIVIPTNEELMIARDTAYIYAQVSAEVC
ncbi:MAG: acetate kinase [Coriobacteriales bacterium]|jgi:acetate kinase|nr:acetate kinase [Coriobacteriales bacterium]